MCDSPECCWSDGTSIFHVFVVRKRLYVAVEHPDGTRRKTLVESIFVDRGEDMHDAAGNVLPDYNMSVSVNTWNHKSFVARGEIGHDIISLARAYGVPKYTIFS